VGEQSFSERLAARCLQITPTDGDLDKAIECLVDYFSCALAGTDLPWSRAATKAASLTAGRHSIIGHEQRTSEADAAFANAVLGHSLVRDDMHLRSISHLGTVIIPTLLALSESQPTTGRAFLTAMIAGYEAGGTLGRAVLDVEVAEIFRPTGICGPVAAAAAGGVMLGQDSDTVAAGIGLAANTASGYNEWAATGGSEMFFQVGYAARNALLAVRLVSEEPNISITAIDGQAGLLAAFDKAHIDAGDAPSRHEIRSVFFKEVPACNFAQTPAQAALKLAKTEDLSPDDIDAVVVFVNHAAARYPGCDAGGPFEHILQAKMSIQYNVAAALLARNFDEQNFRPRERDAIAALAETIELRVDPLFTATYPRHQAARVRVDLRDGRRLAHEFEDVRGAHTLLVEQRFERAARDRLGAARARRLRDCIAALPGADDCSALAELCALPGD